MVFYWRSSLQTSPPYWRMSIRKWVFFEGFPYSLMFLHLEALFHYLHKPLLCKNVTLRIQCVINYFYGWIVRKLFRSKKVPNVYNIIMIMDGYNFEILTCKYYDSMNAFPRSKKQKPWRDIQQVSLSLSSKRSPQYSFCGPLLIRFRFFNS